MAGRKKATPAQVALAWLLTQKPWIVPIPGTTKLHRREENLGAVNVELTPDALHDIEAAASKIEVKGDRYSEAAQKMINRYGCGHDLPTIRHGTRSPRRRRPGRTPRPPAVRPA